MHRALLLLPLALAACATPREQCINQVSQDLRTVTSLIAVTEGNLQRGYAIANVEETQRIRTTCTGTNEDGSTFRFPCEETATIDREVPVAIDLNAEQAKLNSLRERQAALQSPTNAAIQQCVAIHPE